MEEWLLLKVTVNIMTNKKNKMDEELRLKDSRVQQTCTTYFITPIFGKTLHQLTEVGFLDSYLYDKDRPDTEPDGKIIYLLFNPREDQKLSLGNIIEEWDKKGIVVEDYDYEGGYIVVGLRFPNKYKADYLLFLKGKYSKMSMEYQELFARKVSALSSTGLERQYDSLQFMVFNKRVKMKNYWEDILGIELDKDYDEYWSKPIIESKLIINDDGTAKITGETLDINLIEEKNQINEHRSSQN